MEKAYDAIVIGAGPSGSFAAFHLARKGFRVAVFEEHTEVGIPSHCAGHLSLKGLKLYGLDRLSSPVVENAFRGATFFSPSGKAFSVRFDSPVTCVVNRSNFDRHVAEMAEKAGATYLLGARVDSLVVNEGVVEGLKVIFNGQSESYKSKIVIDAEGIASRFVRQAGLKPLATEAIVNGVEAEFADAHDLGFDSVDVYFGNKFAPGFYAWLIPKPDGRAKVGLGAKKVNPKKLLQKFVKEHPVVSTKLRGAKLLKTSYHPISLGGVISRAYSGGLLVVGDAASQVKPTTGGGVIFGMTCARIASKVAAASINANDSSSNFLRQYQIACEKILGFDNRIMLKMRGILDDLSDRQLNNLIGFCEHAGIGQSLRNFGDLDFQGRSLFSSLRSPKVLGALTYFLLEYLFGNI